MEIVMGRKFDHFGLGALVGLTGSIVGYVLFAWIWAMVNNSSIIYFTEEIFIKSDLFRDKIITVAILFNVLLFALFLQLKYYRLCRGILLIILLSIPAVIYFN